MPNTEPGKGSQSIVGKVSEAAEMASAISSGKPLKCKLTKGADYMDYFLESGKMRMDNYATKDEGGTPKTSISHMINDGEYLYLWTEGEGTAIKIKAPEPGDTTALKDQADKYTSQAPKFESEDDYRALQTQGYTINCESVGSSATQFVPPADITFTDVASMMQALPSPAGGVGMTQEQIQQLQEQFSNKSQ